MIMAIPYGLGYIASGESDQHQHYPYSHVDHEGIVEPNSDGIMVRIRLDARSILGSAIFKNEAHKPGEFVRYSEIDLDSMAWLEENRGRSFVLAADSGNEWQDERYYHLILDEEAVRRTVGTSKQKSVRQSAKEELLWAANGYLVPIGLCEVVTPDIEPLVIEEVNKFDRRHRVPTW